MGVIDTDPPQGRAPLDAEPRGAHPVSTVIPGGILPTDFLHVDTCDDTCSRCREAVAEDDVPLMLWKGDGGSMFVFCSKCTGLEAE